MKILFLNKAFCFDASKQHFCLETGQNVAADSFCDAVSSAFCMRTRGPVPTAQTRAVPGFTPNPYTKQVTSSAQKSAGCESIDHDREPFQSLQGRSVVLICFASYYETAELPKSKPVGQNMPTIAPGIGVDGHSAAFFYL